MKKLLRSILAILCSASLLLGTIGGELGAVLAEDTSSTVTPPEFEQITFSDFGIANDEYGWTPFISGGNEYRYPAAQGSYDGGIKNKTFVGKVNFSSTSRSCITFGGKSDGSTGFALGTWLDGRISYWDVEWKTGDPVSIAADATTGVIGNTQEVKISFEVFAKDTDGTENDVRIWLYFGGTLYKDAPLCELTDYADELGNYVGIMTYTDTDSTVTVESVEPPAPPAESIPADFTPLTHREFGFTEKTYEAQGESEQWPAQTTNSLKPVPSMNQVRFDTKITMGTSTRLIYMASNNNKEAGVRFTMQDDGKIWLYNSLYNSTTSAYTGGKIWVDGQEVYCYLDPAIAIEGSTTFIDQPLQLTITTEFVAYDDEEVNDLELGVWFNYKLYNEQYFYIKDCIDEVKPGINLFRGKTGTITLENPSSVEPIETNESYNLSDGPYLVSGTGTITVNGEVKPNGTTLTEPGTYVIISDNERITRNVTLSESGSASSAITYEDGVMPIVGYHGPYNGTDDRGNKYNLITDENYKLLADAGFNLINKIDMNWSDAKDRIGIIQSLEYAEKYGIGLYVWDNGLHNVLTDEAVAKQIANYSQYESFKGIYVTDEPETQSYDNPKIDSSLSYYAEQAKTINQYCNMNAYINLLPKVAAYGDFSTYVDEYLTMTEGKMISYDYYAFGKTYNTSNSAFVDTGTVSGHFDNLSSVRAKAKEKGIPFWPYVQVGNYWNVGSNTDGMTTTNNSPTREQLLWNVNTSLAYGAKGIQYFPMVQPDYFAYATNNAYDYERNGVLGANGEPTQWYPHVKEANAQIAVVDEYLLAATSEEVLAKGTAAQADTKISDEAYGSLETITVSDTLNGAVVGAFDYQGRDMFYVVNYDTTDTTTSDTITLNFKATKAYRLIQDGVTSFGEGKACELTIAAGEAALVIVEDAMQSGDTMTRLTPVNFGLNYTTYDVKNETLGEDGETNGTCAELDSMNGVMFKTRIKLESGSSMVYLMNGTNHWAGIKFRTSGQTLYLDNTLTEKTFYAGDTSCTTAGYGYTLRPNIALGEGVDSLVGKEFDLTLTTEYVAYNDTEVNDLKLGIYFNDKLYNDTYFYILDCTANCNSSLFLLHQSGEITLSDPVVFGSELQPEITDSIAMTYRTFLTDVVTEAPTMTFTRNGKETSVKGWQKSAKVWEFTYPEIYAQNMAEAVTATLKVGDYTKTYELSMLDYCAYVLNLKAGTIYTEEQLSSLKNLIVDLVQYGDSVQQYKGVSADSDALLTKKMETMVPGYAQFDKTDETTFDGLSGVGERLKLDNGITDTEAYTWKNARLVLDNKVKIRYQFAATSVDNLKVKATIQNETVELTIEETDDGNYSVDFDEIYAYEYDEPISVKFYESGKQVGKTVYYSVNTYLDAMQGYTEVDASLWSQLLLAIHNYGMSAKSYQTVR